MSQSRTDSMGSELRLGRSVSIDQAAALLGVSRRTIYNRIRDGRLQTIRTLGGSQRVLVESLYDFGFRPQAFPTSASAASFPPRLVAPKRFGIERIAAGPGSASKVPSLRPFTNATECAVSRAAATRDR